jgi:Flp pilus assembly protein, ATPase CpaF
MDMDVKKIISEVRRDVTAEEREVADLEVMELIEKKVFSSDAARMFSHREIDRIVRRAFYAIRKDLDIIEPYAEDPEVTEIMINGKDNIFIEKNGRIEKTDMYFEETADLEEVIRRVASKVHREINELNPIVDARLDDGSRVNAVYKNVAFGGPTFTIRKFPEKAYTMDDMLRFGTITAECAEYLHTLVLTGHNIFISGGTSSGKTTLLNVLSNYIPKHERVIVIEDSLELQIENIDNIVRLECKNANVSGRGGVTMRDLIKTSLRMRPDRIIVGEVRGREIIDMLAAMNTGHDGSLSTGHGNSIEGMLRRLESMYLQAANFPIEAIRSQIVEGIDVIVHLGRLDGIGRRVLDVSEIEGMESGWIKVNKLFGYRPGTGLTRTGNRLINREKLELRGGAVDGDRLREI